MRLQNKIATIIILVVSGSAFIAGWYQNIFRTEASNLREEAASLEKNLSRMEAKAQTILVKDTIMRLEGERYMNDAEVLDTEYSTLNATLSPLERQSYINQIFNLLLLSREINFQLFISDLFYHFEEFKLSIYNIAYPDLDGYNYTITKDTWDSYVKDRGFPVINITNQQFFGHLQSFKEIDSMFTIYIPADAALFKNIHIGSTDFFLFSNIRQVESQIEAKLDLADQKNAQADQVTLGVTLTAVATILSAAMANRIDEREDRQTFAEIKASIKQEEGIRKKKIDYISVPVLIIAGALAVLGVVIPLFLT